MIIPESKLTPFFWGEIIFTRYAFEPEVASSWITTAELVLSARAWLEFPRLLVAVTYESTDSLTVGVGVGLGVEEGVGVGQLNVLNCPGLVELNDRPCPFVSAKTSNFV